MLWLTMANHKTTPRWYSKANYYGVLGAFRMLAAAIHGYRYGYRSFTVSFE